MKFRSWLRKLEKKKIISRRPHPIFPFVLFVIIIICGFWAYNLELNKSWSYSLFGLAGFTLVFAILHLIVVKVISRK